MQSHIPPPPAQLSDAVFIPPPERIPAILDHIDSAFSSLADVASVERTTVEALSAWLMLPEIQERQRAMDSAAATRARSLATRNLHLSVAALSRMIQGHVIDDPIEPYETKTKDILARARLREVTRKACHLLLHIARFDPASPSQRSQIRRGGAVCTSWPKAEGWVPSVKRTQEPAAPSPTPDLSLHQPLALASQAGAPPRRVRRESCTAIANSGGLAACHHELGVPASAPGLSHIPRLTFPRPP